MEIQICLKKIVSILNNIFIKTILLLIAIIIFNGCTETKDLVHSIGDFFLALDKWITMLVNYFEYAIYIFLGLYIIIAAIKFAFESKEKG